MTESGWLIERYASNGQPLYWCGLAGWLGGNLWSIDSLAAVRFARESDATAVARCLPSPSGLAREHMWG